VLFPGGAPISEVIQQDPQVVVVQGQVKLVFEYVRMSRKQGLIQVTGGFVSLPGRVPLAKSVPNNRHPVMPFGLDRLAAVVVSLAVGKRLPARQRPFQVSLLLRTQLRLRADQMLDRVVGAR